MAVSIYSPHKTQGCRNSNNTILFPMNVVFTAIKRSDNFEHWYVHDIPTELNLNEWFECLSIIYNKCSDLLPLTLLLFPSDPLNHSLWPSYLLILLPIPPGPDPLNSYSNPWPSHPTIWLLCLASLTPALDPLTLTLDPLTCVLAKLSLGLVGTWFTGLNFLLQWHLSTKAQFSQIACRNVVDVRSQM